MARLRRCANIPVPAGIAGRSPNPMSTPPQSTEADLEALDALFERLSGFDDTLSLEWFDGCLAALICVPRVLAPSQWLPLLFDDTWERTFADPHDVEQALGTLLRRWDVVAAQLDPEALFGEPERLRLQPLMDELDPALRDRLLAEGELTPEQAADWPGTGEIWAIGFLETIERVAGDWTVIDDGSDDAQILRECLQCVQALVERDAVKLRADLAARHPGRALSRDELIDEACFAVQDLRCFWLEQSLRPAPRHVEKGPGRNDPCPCGSGRKFKKCHGAPGAQP